MLRRPPIPDPSPSLWLQFLRNRLAGSEGAVSNTQLLTVGSSDQASWEGSRSPRVVEFVSTWVLRSNAYDAPAVCQQAGAEADIAAWHMHKKDSGHDPDFFELSWVCWSFGTKHVWVHEQVALRRKRFKVSQQGPRFTYGK